MAQEGGRKKSQLEKINENKNKANRSKKRRGEKARSNKRQQRAIRAKTRSRQGERAHQGDITGRRVRYKSTPTRSSSANYAKPNPYAGKKRNSEASAAKMAQRRGSANISNSASRSGERAGARGGKISPRSASSARRNVHPQTSPYVGKRRPSESDKARAASRSRQGFQSATRPGEGGKKRKRVAPRSASMARKSISPGRVSPYAGRKRTTEADRARAAAKGARVPKSISSARRSTGSARVNPYAGKPRRTEADKARSAARNKSVSQSASRASESARRRSISTPRSVSGQRKPTAKGISPYAGKKRITESDKARAGARFTGQVRSVSGDRPPQKRKRITPRSVSARYEAKRKRNPYAMHEQRPGEKAHSRDITGRRFKPRAPSGMPPPAKSSANVYFGRKKMGDKAYSGKAGKVSARTVARPGERAWQGDISGRKLRNNRTPVKATPQKPKITPYFGRKKKGDSPFTGKTAGRGAPSVTRRSEDKPGSPMQTRKMSITGQVQKGRKPAFSPYASKKKRGDVAYQGRLSGSKYQSATRPAETPSNQPLSKRRNMSATASFKGPGKRAPSPYLKGRRGDVPYQGRLSGSKYQSATRPAETPSNQPLSKRRNMSATASFKGPGKRVPSPYLQKGRRGDVPYQGRIPKTNYQSATRGAEEGGKRPKFVGTKSLSVTGQLAGPGKKLPQKPQSKTGKQISVFQGNRKARKPFEGGGSVSTQWNNKGEPITVRRPGKELEAIGKFQGNIKAAKPLKGGGSISTQWNNEGQPLTKRNPGKGALAMSTFSGHQKGGKPLKGGGSVSRGNWNNEEQPLQKKAISPQIYFAARFSGNTKARKPLKGGGSVYRDNWNNDEEPLQKKAISPQIYFAARFTGTLKEKKVNKKPDTDAVQDAGLVKVKRNSDTGFHPSFYYGNRKEHKASIYEKDKKLSFTLMWSKLFRTNQPKHLRKKNPKLEFDKGEEGMWYD